MRPPVPPSSVPSVAELRAALTPRQLLAAAALATVGLGLTLIYGGELVARLFIAQSDKAEFVQDRRSTEPATYPAITPQILLAERDLYRSGADTLLPLGGIARIPTVFCQEAGDYLVYRSDRYGFHNPDDVWDRSPLDVAIVGDSFAQGACVPSDRNIPALLRRAFPAVLNLGSFGNGPLATLATIREYLGSRRPRHVIWLYVTNDIGYDLGLERTSPILVRYLSPDFSQRLAGRQPELDEALKAFLDRRLTGELQRLERSWGERLADFAGLAALRRVARVAHRRWALPPPPTSPKTADYDRFRALDRRYFQGVLAVAQAEVTGWGGQLHVVLVPDARMLGGYEATPQGLAPADFVATIAPAIGSLGIPVIDLYATFRALENPMAYYAPMDGYYGHFNEAGYALAADAIRARLDSLPGAP